MYAQKLVNGDDWLYMCVIERHLMLIVCMSIDDMCGGGFGPSDLLMVMMIMQCDDDDESCSV